MHTPDPSSALPSVDAPERRPVSGPIVRGSCLGGLTGLVLGASVILVVALLGAFDGQDLVTKGSDLAAWILTAGVTAMLGGIVGGVLGAFGGLGAVVVPERGTRRRFAVAACTFVAGLVFILVFRNPIAGWGAIPYAIAYLVIGTTAAWLESPLLDGRTIKPIDGVPTGRESVDAES